MIGNRAVLTLARRGIVVIVTVVLGFEENVDGRRRIEQQGAADGGVARGAEPVAGAGVLGKAAQVVEIHRQPARRVVGEGAGDGRPAVAFRDDPRSYSGSDGCRRLTGNYAVAGEALSLQPSGTMLACAEATETPFTSALRRVARYRVLGSSLDLYDAEGLRLARFTARATH